MPFQHTHSAASTQLLPAPSYDLVEAKLLSHSSVQTTKSALAEPSSRSREHHDAPGGAPPRKQHHVSFQDESEHADPPAPSGRRRGGRPQRSSNSNSRTDNSDPKDKSAEHSSSRQSNSRASSRQSRRDQSEPESSRADSSRAGGQDSAASSSTRQRRRHRHRERRSERSQNPNLEHEPIGAQSTRSEVSSSPSKKDTRSRDGSAAGRRSRQHSGRGILPDLRNQDTSRSEAGSRSQHSASSRRDRFGRSHDARSLPGEASASRDGRQLFDPRRDDPVKFATQQRNQVEERARSGSGAPSPRLGAVSSMQPQILMRRDLSSTSSASHLGRSPVIKPSISDMALAPAVDPSDPRALQAHVVEIKKVYRSIASTESQLQETHQAETEKARLQMGDYVPPDVRDPSYWITLIGKHRDLAECHSSFLEMTCRPELPGSVQELAEVYNLPSRLWQTAFHLMLESLRTNLSSHHNHQGAERRAELLDHLTEFIYYAYSFYSALHESERYKNFRRAWIESLGDLSRYRMAVAGLAANMSIDGGGEEIRNKRADGPRSASPVDTRIDDDDDDDFSSDLSDESDNEDDDQEFDDKDGVHAIPPTPQTKDEVLANNFEKASIGSAALGDWEWTEKETWRQTAKDWYALGITETPNVGRLHHHFGVLSRGDNDLRALYHLTKSLIAAKPFSSARDTILDLFDQGRQARRLRRDSSIEDLFLYLHGVLFTRVQLDDFEEVFERLMTKLSKLVEEDGPAGLSQSVWMMMANINIAGLFQYGADNSILADLLLQQSGKSAKRTKKTERSKTSTPTAIIVSSAAGKSDNNFLSELPRDAEWDDPSDDESEAGDDVQVISLEAKHAGEDQGSATAELPAVLERAARLCFSMQALTFDLSSVDIFYRSNPYNTIIATFLISLCQSKKASRLLERFIPWDLWLQHVEMSVSLIERDWPKSLATPFITAQLLLPEDLCLRGILGLSRHLYDRGLWRSASNDGSFTSQGFDNEVEVLDADDGEFYTRREAAWWRAAGSRNRDGDKSHYSSLDRVRAYRMAFVARKLAKAGRGFDLDTKTSTLSLSKLLLGRLARYSMEAEQREVELRIQQLRLQSSAADALLTQHEERTAYSRGADQDDDFDSDFDEDDLDRHPAAHEVPAALPLPKDVGALEEIQALHERSCYLRDMLRNMGSAVSGKRSDANRSTKGSDRAASKQKSIASQPSPWDDVVPGYTILVVDTNIIVTPGDVIAKLIESQRWTVIIPLAVITELDGLRRNDSDLGKEAERAIQFLESRIRTHTKYVKVQTSRGNYLSDLSCRSEDIDFTWQGSGAASSAQSAVEGSPRLDTAAATAAVGGGAGEGKSVAARNVDEVILRILAWQRDNFVDRRTLIRAGSGSGGADGSGDKEKEGKLPASAQKSVLLTLDRNLRLKAKSRGLASLDAKGAACLLESATKSQ